MASACKVLLGSDNVQEVNDVFCWITGRNTLPVLLRLESRPQKKPVGRSVCLGVDFGIIFYLVADDVFIYLGPARGVRVGSQKILQSK